MDEDDDNWHTVDHVLYAWSMLFNHLCKYHDYEVGANDVKMLKLALRSRQTVIRHEAFKCLIILNANKVNFLNAIKIKILVH